MTRDYYTALYCLNGHHITRELELYGGDNFCKKCGEKTISECPECQEHIQGRPRWSNVRIIGSIPPPAYCHNCGKPYPWTIIAIETAKNLVKDAEELSTTERDQLVESISDIMVDTPKTELAATRFKKLINKVGTTTRNLLYQWSIDFASETAVKLIKEGK